MTNKTVLASVMPGLIALRCTSAGEAVTLSLLGIGVVETGGTPFEDDRIAASYATLATESDPAHTVLDYWRHQESEHPHMRGHLEPITEVLKGASEDRVRGLREAAAYLATVSMSGTEHLAKADLMGRVLTEFVALANKRPSPGHAFTLAEAMADLVLRILTGELPDPDEVGDRQMSFTDVWADSGMRAVALATLMRQRDQDATKVKWRLWEADPMRRAILAINTVAWELGDDVVIKNGTDVKKAMLAAAQSGQGPRWWNDDIPADVRSMVRDG